MKRTGRGNLYRLVLIVGLLSVRIHAEKQKRQIFREQVLPALGGKIPEDAFRTDRLALNRLNKEGITVPDGVVLDARHVHKHPHQDQVVPEIIKVYLTPDGRYVPPEGRFHYNHPKSVDTTYVIRSPYGRGGRYKSNNNFGLHKVPRIYPKPQSYYRPRIVPLIPPAKPGIYKPVVAPLVLPANDDLLDQSYLPGWNIGYDWDTVYRPFDDYFLNNIAYFNSHQIITDYQGFLNEFHERASRHVATKSGEKNRYQGTNDRRHQQKTRTNPQVTSYPRPQENRGDSQNPGYPNLTKMPETTNFSCHGRKGTFADVETKCQVFHECSGWSRTSSLCPSGTVYSEAKKRCEWWNTVECGH